MKVADEKDDGTTTPRVGVGYQEPDVEYHEENDDTLRRLWDNDPDIAGLDIPLARSHGASYDYYDYRVEVHDANRDRILGYAIGGSKHLRKLKITGRNGFRMAGATHKFLQRVAENRSIEHLCLNEFSGKEKLFKFLVPFFEHNQNMRSIEICGTELNNLPKFFSVIFRSEMIRIERISLSSCTNSSSNWIIRDLIRGLKCMPGLSYLSDLSLEGNQMGRTVSIELFSLLRNNATRLQIIQLGGSNVGNDCINHITSGLQESTVKVLRLAHLRSTTPKGWKTFSAYLSNPSCSVETLDLSGNNIGDGGYVALGNAMAKNKKLKLKSLNLNECNSVSSTGWRGLSIGMRSLAIEELQVRGTGIDDDGAIAIVSSLNGQFLKSLNMGHSRITPRGWVQCFRLLEGCASSLKSLFLDCNRIDDEGADVLVRLATKTLSLSKLSLWENRSITMERWCAFASLLHTSSSSKLNVLKLGATDHGAAVDDYVIAFAQALTNNTSLEVLGLLGSIDENEDEYFEDEDLDFPDDEISMQGWNAIARTLCDNSSISSICSSNHTLYEMWRSDYKRYLDGDAFPCAIFIGYESREEQGRSGPIKDPQILFH